jgi:hypothetical protein
VSCTFVSTGLLPAAFPAHGVAKRAGAELCHGSAEATALLLGGFTNRVFMDQGFFQVVVFGSCWASGISEHGVQS